VSVAVSLGALGGQVEQFGTWPYVVTVSKDGRPHAVSVEMAWDGSVFRGTGGRGTLANAAERPAAVTLLWPPFEPGGYSLIVDGTAAVTDGVLTLTPATAVLHRTGPPREDSPTTCTSDCIRI
jgi:hypothetical protein